jgi:hypothetical protein
MTGKMVQSAKTRGYVAIARPSTEEQDPQM